MNFHQFNSISLTGLDQKSECVSLASRIVGISVHQRVGHLFDVNIRFVHICLQILKTFISGKIANNLERNLRCELSANAHLFDARNQVGVVHQQCFARHGGAVVFLCGIELKFLLLTFFSLFFFVHSAVE